jgi:hypothetical protein
LLPKERVREAKLILWQHRKGTILGTRLAGRIQKEIYASDAEYFADITKAYRTELEILYDAVYETSKSTTQT